ncbi:MAG: DUF58 domain-containing protein [Myxococcales bacterium]|nr:DUF58 domain-containing protein [Myxococcales bacterium]
MKIDWARLNYILIPTPPRAAGAPGKPLPRVVRVFIGIGRSLTDTGRAMLVATFLVGALSLDISRTTAYVLFAVLAGVVYTSLAAGRLLSPKGLSASLRGPARAVAGEDVSFVVVAKNDTDEAREVLVVRGPFLPHFGEYVRRPTVVESVPPSGEGTSIVTLRFTRRGDLHLDPFRVARLVPLGLSTGPAVETEPLRLRVVPRPANVTRVDVLGAARHQPGGVPLASRTGESMDLKGVRPYRPGDPLRDLHARTWARTGTPFVREYQEEYFSRVGVVLDTDASDEASFEAAVSLAAGVVARLARGETLVDLLLVGDDLSDLTIGRSLGFLDQALDALAVAEHKPGFDAARLVARLAPYAGRLSAVVFVTTSWDARRAEVVAAIEERGPAVRAILVGRGEGPFQAVDPESIERGEALSL